MAQAGLWAALRAGMAQLSSGGSSLDAVEAAVCALEDCEVFNAGKGSVYTHTGQQEMDAAIMDGSQRQAGAIAGVQGVRNPIRLARRVMEATPHVMLIGAGAEAFAREQGIPFEAPEYFHNDFRWQQLLQIRDLDRTALDHDLDMPSNPAAPDGKFGTVGAVALDAQGHLAAATSTGGMTNKRFGRVGDSPIIGAGTYADANCAVSATGHGEYLLRAVIGHDLAARQRYSGQSLEQAATEVIADLHAMGGDGGLIALDARGNWAMPFSNGRMYRGWLSLSGEGEVWIY